MSHPKRFTALFMILFFLASPGHADLLSDVSRACSARIHEYVVLWNRLGRQPNYYDIIELPFKNSCEAQYFLQDVGRAHGDLRASKDKVNWRIPSYGEEFNGNIARLNSVGYSSSFLIRKIFQISTRNPPEFILDKYHPDVLVNVIFWLWSELRTLAIYKHADKLLHFQVYKNANGAFFQVIADSIKWSKQDSGRTALDYFIVWMGRGAHDKELARERADFLNQTIKERNIRRILQTFANHKTVAFRKRAEGLLERSDQVAQESGLEDLKKDVEKLEQLEIEAAQLQSSIDQLSKVSTSFAEKFCCLFGQSDRARCLDEQKSRLQECLAATSRYTDPTRSSTEEITD